LISGGFHSPTGSEPGAMETPQHGNISTRKCLKTGFEEFPFYFGKSLKTGKC